MAATTTTNGKSKMAKMAPKAVKAMNQKTSKSTIDYRVCKEAMENPKVFQELARWGREEILIAEKEMPGLMALRKEYGKQKPL